RGGADGARGRVGMVGSPRHEPRHAGLADRLERAVRRRDQLRPRRLSALARPAPRDDGRRRSVRRRRAGRAAAGALAHLSSRAPGPRALRAGRPRRDARGACAGWHRHVLPRRARPTDRTGCRRRRQPPDGRGPAGARAEWVEPLRVAYRNGEAASLPPPTQGFAALAILSMLEGFDIGSLPEADYVHLVVEATKLAFEDRDCYLT